MKDARAAKNAQILSQERQTATIERAWAVIKAHCVVKKDVEVSVVSLRENLALSTYVLVRHASATLIDAILVSKHDDGRREDTQNRKETMASTLSVQSSFASNYL
jgi:hypothetical protein